MHDLSVIMTSFLTSMGSYAKYYFFDVLISWIGGRIYISWERDIHYESVYINFVVSRVDGYKYLINIP